MLGVAVGDALGAPLEFMTAEEIKSRHGIVRDMLGGGWLNVEPGEVTDDTQMTLAVAGGILANPKDPIPEIGKYFIKWYDSQPKDIGNACRTTIGYAKEYNAADAKGWYKAARRFHDETGGQTAGNGALMRTIYPALYYGNGRPDCALSIACMTHVHEHSRRSVTAYTQAVVDLTSTDNSTEWGKERIEYHVKNVRELIDESKLKPSGYAPESLICAANAIRDTSSFEDALIYAVNLGGDADTIGAITGGLAGALYGGRNIPLRWINELANEPNRGKRNADNFMARMLTDIAQIAYAERTGKPMAAVQFGENSIKKFFEKF